MPNGFDKIELSLGKKENRVKLINENAKKNRFGEAFVDTYKPDREIEVPLRGTGQTTQTTRTRQK